MLTQSIRVDYIETGERQRALSQDAVERLAKSMAEIGLHHPISIRFVDDYQTADGDTCDGVPLLVAGAHRLAAAKSLGWEKIDCIEVEDDPVKSEMWEIAENLHRCDLTKNQRDNHIRRYAELLEARAALIVTPMAEQLKTDINPKGAGRSAGITRQIADATGLSHETVRRAIKQIDRKQPLTVAPQILKPVVEPEAEPEAGHDAIIQAANKIIAVWNAAPIEARELAGAVFDRTKVGHAATTVQGGDPC